MWWSSFCNKLRDKNYEHEQEKLRLEREMEHENQVDSRKKNAQSKLQHYLSSKFTNECASIIKMKIESKELLLTDLQFVIKPIGIFYGYSQYVSNSYSFSDVLINFRDHGYNELTIEAERDSFALAICTILGMNFDVIYYVPYDREYDWNSTLIVSNRKVSYKDI